MKKILGLDLGPNSIGWAFVNEAETENESSSIIKLGVRINLLSADEIKKFNTQKGSTPNADRTLKHGMRRNLQRYKLRRDNLIDILVKNNWITHQTILSENGNNTTFETYRLRARAVKEKVSLEEFARILLMLNKKRGYKSNRKANENEDGALIDSIDIARKLYDEHLSPGEYCLSVLRSGKRLIPDFYKSDLDAEFDRIWACQQAYYPEILTNVLKQDVKGKTSKQTWAILSKNISWTETVNGEVKECHLVGIKRPSNKNELKLENYTWRVAGLTQKLDLEQLTIVLQEINNNTTASSGYLGSISDHSKELLFNHMTVGQYLMKSLDENPNRSLKNVIFYRQDYLDEFEALWTKQAEYYPELTDELKREIRDVIIFYQRRLKSKKGLVGYCELEQKQITVNKDGKEKIITIGSKQIPKSSPLFQEFKVWQTLNNITVSLVGKQKKKVKATEPGLFGVLSVEDDLYYNGPRSLTLEEKQILAKNLFIKEKMTKAEILKLLFDGSKALDLNFKDIQGNLTGAKIYKALAQIIELTGHKPIDFKDSVDDIYDEIRSVFAALGWKTDFLNFDSSLPLKGQQFYNLWHLLYSYESDNSQTGTERLKDRLVELCGIDKEYANILAAVNFDNDYGNLSAKAINKIMPYLKEGLTYDKACEQAGYRHSKSSITKEENDARELKDQLSLLAKNSLRNPVVEKVLNQMVNVVNQLIDTYGCPDEIRVELARELKKNADERRKLTDAISSATKDQEAYRKILHEEFGIQHVSRNDIIKYRLYKELEGNGYHTLYSDTYIRKEELFGKQFDIEHIIPQARLFDDSFSNKTLELKSINIEKGNKTAYDYVLEKYGEDGLQRYVNRCEALFDAKSPKLRKLMMQESQIPEGFIERDLRNTQYISRMAVTMLKEICRTVTTTTGAITDQLREDWQLVDVLKELNWDKYQQAGQVEYFNDRDGRTIGKIKDWTKRNDHRHHAMDALTVAFTKPVFVQYFNNKNASFKPNSNEYAIKAKYVANRKVIPPIPLETFRTTARKHLEEVLISLQAKNKVVTRNLNKTKSKHGDNVKVQLTPRGQLHEETIYGSHLEYVCKEEKVNASFDKEKILTVAVKAIREALLQRLQENGGDPKKAFTGKNALDKKPILINPAKGIAVPLKVKTVTIQRMFTIRKPVTEDLQIDKVVDKKIRQILLDRIKEYGSAKLAFANLDENPIWINKEKGIQLRRVTIRTSYIPTPIRDKRDKDGHLILNSSGITIPNDYVNPKNNHHIAIYRKPKLDKQGLPALDNDGNTIYELEERVVSFLEAVERMNQGQDAVDKNYRSDEGWSLLFTMKQNEYFVFPNSETGFNPKAIDLMNPKNYSLISPNLYRVQKLSSMYYCFRHQLETTVEDNKALQNKTWKRITSLTNLVNVVKVRVNHIGQIVAVGEY